MTDVTHTQRGAPTQSGQKSESEHFALVAGEATNKVENEVEKVGQLENNRASIFLGEGSQKKRTKGIGQHEDTEHQILFDLIGDMELGRDGG